MTSTKWSATILCCDNDKNDHLCRAAVPGLWASSLIEIKHFSSQRMYNQSPSFPLHSFSLIDCFGKLHWHSSWVTAPSFSVMMWSEISCLFLISWGIRGIKYFWWDFFFLSQLQSIPRITVLWPDCRTRTNSSPYNWNSWEVLSCVGLIRVWKQRRKENNMATRDRICKHTYTHIQRESGDSFL